MTDSLSLKHSVLTRSGGSGLVVSVTARRPGEIGLIALPPGALVVSTPYPYLEGSGFQKSGSRLPFLGTGRSDTLKDQSRVLAGRDTYDHGRRSRRVRLCGALAPRPRPV